MSEIYNARMATSISRRAQKCQIIVIISFQVDYQVWSNDHSELEIIEEMPEKILIYSLDIFTEITASIHLNGNKTRMTTFIKTKFKISDLESPSKFDWCGQDSHFGKAQYRILNPH